jgi:hypothetical protein
VAKGQGGGKGGGGKKDGGRNLGPDGKPGNSGAGDGKPGKKGDHKGSGGGKNGGGKGGGGKGGPPKYGSKKLRHFARASAGLAFNPAIRESRGEIQRAKRQDKVIDAAFDEYISRMTAAQNAQGGAQQAAQANVQNAALALQQNTGDLAGSGQEQAQANAAIMGQGNQVSDAIGALAAGGQSAIGASALNTLGAQANIGLADSTNLGLRGLAAEQGRLDAHHEAETYRRDQIAEMRGLKADRGNLMMQELARMMQQRKENKLANKSLRADIQANKADQAIAAASLDLDAKELDWEMSPNNPDNKSGGGGGGKGGGGDGGKGGGGRYGAGLSPSEKQDVHRYTRQIKAVANAYEKALKQGNSSQAAKRKALRRTGYDRWMGQIVANMAKHNGKLTGDALQLLKSKMPGGVVPNYFR